MKIGRKNAIDWVHTADNQTEGYNSNVFQILISFPFDIYPEVELLEHMVVLFLIFRGTSILFCIMAVLIYIPSSSAQEFPFSTSSLMLVVACLFDNNYSSRFEVFSYCGFDLHFPGDYSQL